MDFKGWWRAVNGERCEPLTVRDAFSRFVLEASLCRPKTDEVKVRFEQLFRRYGMPSAIQSDNGAPFASVAARGGLSSLSAWLVALGIKVIRSRPGCPQDNGAHERMHRDISASVQAYPAQNAHAQQRDLDQWRQEFNQVRPHQALGGRTPAEVYKPTERRLKMRLRLPTFPPHYRIALVTRAGTISIQNERYFVSGALAGLHIGLEPIAALTWRIWFYEMDLGTLELLSDVSDHSFEIGSSRSMRKKPIKKAEQLST